jgi:hypothetical protein
VIDFHILQMTMNGLNKRNMAIRRFGTVIRSGLQAGESIGIG